MGQFLAGDKNMKVWQCCSLGFALLVFGCGRGATTFEARKEFVSNTPARTAAADQFSLLAAQAPAAAVQAAGKGEADAVVRKIIYKAEVDLVCEDFGTVVERLESLATAAGGFVADARQFGLSGQPRSGEWKLRVPTGRFDGLLADIKKLAEVRSAHTMSDDVSEEYYDVEARIRNKQQEEARLLRLLDDRTAKLEEVLSVEREISRVRGEVEQWQARLRVLSNLTELATLTVRIEEFQGYRPETSATFTVRLVRSVRQSLETLLSAGQRTIIALAVLLPWFALLSMAVLMTRSVVRRFLRRTRSATAP
jgi:hypothetical protein